MKAASGRFLTEAEVRQRSIAGKASGLARHRAETAPSVRQGSTSAPSRQAVGLFRQGQARPDTRARRGPWDTRPTEVPIGAMNARFTFHFPQAYRSASPDPMPRGRKSLAAAVGIPRKPGQAQDLVITNPHVIAEAHRHPVMREVVHKAIGVVRDHQIGAIERAHKRGLIPEGTSPGLVARAYKHAALLALHKAGLGDYDFRMDPTAKADFAPLTEFMRYANRRVFDQLNVQAKGKWVPFREEFGQEYKQRKFGKLTGHVRMRMRPNQEFIKIEIPDDMPLEKAWDDSERVGGANPGVLSRGDTFPKQSREQTRKLHHSAATTSSESEQDKNKNGHNAHFVHRLAAMALARAAAAHKAGLGARGVKHVPAAPGGEFPREALNPGLHIKDAAKIVERHYGVTVGSASRDAPRGGMRKIGGLTRRGENGLYELVDLAKQSESYLFGSDDFGPRLGGYNTNPAAQVRRAMRPRLRRQQHRLRLNTQRNLRRVLGGGITRQERWQIGANPRLPRNLFGVNKRSPIDDHAAVAVRPTEAQAKAGNYRMGHTQVGGLPVTIETPRGGLRMGRSGNGRIWKTRMPAHYGYIKRTEGADGDHVDVYLGPYAHDAVKHAVFVVDQQHADTKAFDETKSFIGFKDVSHVMKTYDAAFSDHRGPERRRAITSLPFDQFRSWVANGDHSIPVSPSKNKSSSNSPREASRSLSQVFEKAAPQKNRDRFVKPLGKGIIGTALSHGMRAARIAGNMAGTTGMVGRHALGSFGRTRAGMAIGRGAGRLAAHPLLAPGVDEARSIGGSQFLKAPAHSAGRILGRGIGRSEKAAHIGGHVALGLDYAPEVILGAKAIGWAGSRKEKKAARRQLSAGTAIERGAGSAIARADRLGKGLLEVMGHALSGRSTATKVGLGIGAGFGVRGGGDYLEDHPEVRAATGAALAGTAAAVASRGHAIGVARRASRAIYTTGMKDAVRQHLRILEGAAPSPHHVAQARHVHRQLKTAVLRQAQEARANRMGAIRVPKKAVAGAAIAGAAAGVSVNPRSTKRRDEEASP